MPDDANFCMSCGADLSQYQQQSSGGSVNTGDVGMIKDSQMESTESQQQASIEQNPTINIYLGEIIRESVSEAMQQGTKDQQQEYERIQETSVSVTPEIADLLKKAKFATSDDEAELYYDQILELDIENDVAWYQKFLLHIDVKHHSLRGMTISGREFDQFKSSTETPRQKLKQILQQRIERSEEMVSKIERQENLDPTDEDVLQMNYDTANGLKSLSLGISYFDNAAKASPQSFPTCNTCQGLGLGSFKECPCVHEFKAGKCRYCEGTGNCEDCGGSGERFPARRGLPAMKCICVSGKCPMCDGAGNCLHCGGTGKLRRLCETCFGMGQVRTHVS